MMRHGLLPVLLAAGCATAPVNAIHFAAGEHMCTHCNCLIPKGTDPHATCAVCTCGKPSHQCVRR